MIYKFVFPGEIPSKKNSRILIERGGRRFSIPGKTYSDWHKRMEKLILTFNRPKKLISSYCSVAIKIFPGTKRKADLENKAGSVLDFLVDMGILKDDNYFIVGSLLVELGGIDRDNPRAEVIIRK